MACNEEGHHRLGDPPSYDKYNGIVAALALHQLQTCAVQFSEMVCIVACDAFCRRGVRYDHFDT